MLKVIAVPAFQDNYLWLMHQEGESTACIVDPGDAAPIKQYLKQHKLQLAAIILTHHHADHIGGVNDLLADTLVPVYGPDSSKIPMVTHPVAEGSEINVAGISLKVLEVPGHTLEHIAYYSLDSVTKNGPVLFCGDTLFAGGCGRMFEGTPPVMQASLQKLAALDPTTQVFCAHEYTLSNLKFAASVMPNNTALQERTLKDKAQRQNGLPTVPSKLGLELQTNPFLRCKEKEVITAAAAHSGTSTQNAAEVFGILRRWKDQF